MGISNWSSSSCFFFHRDLFKYGHDLLKGFFLLSAREKSRSHDGSGSAQRRIGLPFVYFIGPYFAADAPEKSAEHIGKIGVG